MYWLYGVSSIRGFLSNLSFSVRIILGYCIAVKGKIIVNLYSCSDTCRLQKKTVALQIFPQNFSNPSNLPEMNNSRKSDLYLWNFGNQ